MAATEIQEMKIPLFDSHLRLRLIQIKELLQIQNLKLVLKSPLLAPLLLCLTGDDHAVRMFEKPPLDWRHEPLLPSVVTIPERIEIRNKSVHKMRKTGQTYFLILWTKEGPGELAAEAHKVELPGVGSGKCIQRGVNYQGCSTRGLATSLDCRGGAATTLRRGDVPQVCLRATGRQSAAHPA